MEQKFYVCEVCGNMIAMVKSSGAKVVCCGKEMKEMIPGSVDASVEKHVPVIEVKDGIAHVTVGSAAHPMIAAHYIEWISLQTDRGNQRKVLKPDQAPAADFALLPGEKIEAAYAYCNLHGLWKKEI